MTIELSWDHIRAVKQIDRYNRRDNSFVIFLLFFKRKKLNGIVLECINPFCSYAALSLLFHGISPKLAERRCRTRRKHFIGETSSAFNATIVFLTSRKSRQESLSGIVHRFRETRFVIWRQCRNLLAPISLSGNLRMSLQWAYRKSSSILHHTAHVNIRIRISRIYPIDVCELTMPNTFVHYCNYVNHL